MLSVKNLVKVYKTKGGVEVRALDGVTIDFPEKGMVFLLGRSGSGKSTLLNVSGGLDTPTDGEIIVNGVSSQNFSASDFDSYRNTYVGFVFQEYNLLNEFSVEQNIAIALQLQSKPNDKDSVNNILESVDLKGLGKRKPNTLSGGQRQRVAIARALIKEPKIIMADEPTGALDDATGRQIFDTLKKLSQSRLVIVVSHDRDFAEEYADRIIELVDGKVVNDLTKTQVELNVQKNVNLVDENTITVKDWDKVTEEDFKKILSVMKKSGNETVITSGEKQVLEVKKLLNIKEETQKIKFDKTKAIEPVKTPDGKTNFIKSRLPLRHAFKMAGGGLKLKPIRLIFTILLSVIAFTIFGMTSTLMMYDPDYSIATAMQKSNYESVILTKNYSATEQMIERLDNGEKKVTRTQNVNMSAGLTKADIERLNKNDTGLNFIGVMDLGYYTYTGLSNGEYYSPKLVIDNAYLQNEYGWYYPFTKLNGFSDCGHQTLVDNGFKLLAGAYPKDYTEIALPNYTYEFLRDLNNIKIPPIDLSTPNKIIGMQISIAGIKLKVSGVYDVGDVPEKYQVLRNLKSGLSYYEKEALSKELADYINSSFHTVCFVSEDFYPVYKYKFLQLGEKVLHGTRIESWDFKLSIARDEKEYVYTKDSISLYSDTVKIFDVSGQQEVELKTLKENECFVPAYDVITLYGSVFYDSIKNSDDQSFADFISAYERFKDYTESYEDNLLMYRTIMSQYETVVGDTKILSNQYFAKNANKDEIPLDVAGVYFTTTGISGRSSRIIVSDEFCDQIALTPEKRIGTNTDLKFIKSNYDIDLSAERYGRVITLTNNTLDQTYFMLKSGANGISYKMQNLVYETSHYMAEPFSEMKPFFLIAGGVFGLFASLMLFNFISVGIENKKKEIGIIRAVGARGVDVFKIFIIEALIITSLCFVLSAVTSVVLCNIINISASESFMQISFLNFRFVNALILLVLSSIIAFIATILPVGKYVKSSPVDSIRSL